MEVVAGEAETGVSSQLLSDESGVAGCPGNAQFHLPPASLFHVSLPLLTQGTSFLTLLVMKCVGFFFFFFFFPRPSNSLQYQLGVLQLNSVLTQSSWMPYRFSLVRYYHPHFRCQMQLVGLCVTDNFCPVLLQTADSHHPFLGFD